MASHRLAIAKAAFSAGLLRPDPTATSKDEIANFHSLLDSVVAQCSPTNVQNCKRWLVKNIIRSPARITALGKYLAALSASFETPPNGSESRARGPRPSTKRKRLHLLYLLNDLYHHAKCYANDLSGGSSVTTMLQPQVNQLLALAASFPGCPKHQGKLRELLKIWEEKGYYAKEDVDQLRDVVQNAERTQPSPRLAERPSGTGDQPVDVGTAETEVGAPFIMPAMHGDPATPFYDLPAGNMMPHIIPHSTQPINPQLVKPLQLAAGPADRGLVTAVKDFLRDVDQLFESHTVDDEGITADIDELGQPLVRDEVTGEFVPRDTYYGWSKAFCERMKARRRSGPSGNGRGRGRSDSRGRSLSPHKRTRYHRYDSRSGSRRRRSSSPSRSRSRYRPASTTRRGHSRPRPAVRSPPSSRSSHSPGTGRHGRPGHPPSRSRSRSYSPSDHPVTLPPAAPRGHALTSASLGGPPPPPPPYPNGPPVPDPALIAHLLRHNAHLLPAGAHIPPPLPVLSHGPWALPPPPPPPLSTSPASHLTSPGAQMPPYPGYLVPPPPPPPPPPPGPPTGPRGYRGHSGHAPAPAPAPASGNWRPS